MPKRKLNVEVDTDSDLSPPPDGVLDGDTKRQKVTQATTSAKAVSGSRRGKAVKDEPAVGADEPDKTKPAKKRQRKPKVEKEEEEVLDEAVVELKTKRRRKTKEEKEAESMPLAARTVGHKLYIGAHVSGAGGVQNSVANALHIGANAFALFLKSQRKWANPPLLPETCTSFHDHCKQHTYDQAKHVVPHGSYLVNLAHPDDERTKQAYDCFLDDLQRCESLNITLYNFHPGNSVGGDRQKAIAHLASNINRAHRATKTVITLLENMAAGGNVIGSTFEDLRNTIALVEDKSRIGVCLDTCHAFAAGYDLRTPTAFAATMQHFDDVVGATYLRAVHLNDSKAPFASHRDLHANIGTGFLGLRAFHNLVNDPRFVGLPLVLETPISVRDDDGNLVRDEKNKEKEDKAIWAQEIKMLERLVGMDVESEEFLGLEKKLQRKGESERKKMTEQQERKREKEEKKSKSPRKKRGKKVDDTEDGNEEDGSDGEE